MNILIDFTQIPLQKVGVGVYALNLISEIYNLDQQNMYYLVIQDDEYALNFITRSNFKIIKVRAKFFRKFILRFLLENTYLPFLALKYKIDIAHSLHYSFPLLMPAKKIVTIHDMTVFKIPKEHMFIRVCYLRLFIFLAAFFADRIITDSKSTLDDFLQRFKLASIKCRVIYLGKNASFNHNLEKNKIENVKNKYKIEKEYLLYMGTIEPRKNIKNLISAFYKLLQEDNNYQLVIAGRRGWYFDEVFRLVEELHLDSKINFTDFVNEQDKPYLIVGAKIFIYPSLYEGFGLPVLEALSCGIPTITSNISSLPEVTGDAALLINPSNAEELYLSIKRLLSDEVLYAQLKQRAIEQAKKFSWEYTAQQTLEVYNSL